jgi:hypothetical protein
MPIKSFGRKNYFKHEMRLTQLLAARPADDILRNFSDKIQPKAIETGTILLIMDITKIPFKKILIKKKLPFCCNGHSGKGLVD